MLKVRSFGDSMLDGFLKLLVLVIAFVFAYPFLYSLSVSFSDPMAVTRLEVKLFPVGFSLGAYELVFQSERLWRAYGNTVLYTGVGTFVRVLLLIITAYPLSRKRFPGRTFFTFAYTFTMLFGGGLIPSYLVVRAVGLMDTMWAIIIPGGLAAYSIIIVRTFFQTTIPTSLEETASIDGANDIQILAKVVLPLSAPIVAVMSLFAAVAIWNTYFQAILYLRTATKWPLPVILRSILVTPELFGVFDHTQIAENRIPTKSVQTATLMVSVLPIMLLYPVLQRYFVKGILIGAIKG